MALQVRVLNFVAYAGGYKIMVGADICHTRRRRRNLPHASDTNSVVGAYNHHCTRRRGQQDLAYIHSPSLTCKAIPFIYKRGCTLSQKGGDRSVHSHTTTEPLGSNLEHMLEHIAHSEAPITLGPSDQSLTRPLVPPIFLLLICNPTTNFEHLSSGIKSPIDSN